MDLDRVSEGTAGMIRRTRILGVEGWENRLQPEQMVGGDEEYNRALRGTPGSSKDYLELRVNVVAGPRASSAVPDRTSSSEAERCSMTNFIRGPWSFGMSDRGTIRDTGRFSSWRHRNAVKCASVQWEVDSRKFGNTT